MSARRGYPDAPCHAALAQIPRIAPVSAAQQDRLAQRMMELDVPAAQIIRIVNGTCGKSLTAREIQSEFRQYSRQQTPYGTVAQTHPIQMSDGTQGVLYLNNPFALLFAAATKSPKFADFLLHHVRQREGLARIVIYSDETSPGNQLRPGNNRSYECVQWTFAEFPGWYKARRFGWFKLGYVLSGLVCKVEGGMPAIMKQILQIFFAPHGYNMAVTGVDIPQETGPPETLHAKFVFFLEDEKAMKINSDVKGAGGLRCCALECMNVVKSIVPPHPGNCFVRHDEPDRSKWIPHTKESFLQTLAEIERVKDDLDSLSEVEIATGIKYNPHSLLWDSYLRELIGAPHHHFWDAMHCLYSSGGCVQYQLNAYVLELCRSHITVDDLDTFAHSCKGHRLPKKFFSERIVYKAQQHIKAFASECMDAVYVLGLFTDMVVIPSGRFAAAAACFKLLVQIQKVLANADNVYRNVDLLEDLTARHQISYNTMGYHRIPKHHFGRHIVDCVRRHKVFMSCFAPERDHSASKHIANHSFRNSTMTILDRSNYQFFAALQHSETLFRETYLQNAVEIQSYNHLLEAGATVFASDKLVCKFGEVSKDTYVWMYDEQSQEPVLRISQLFLEVRLPFASHAYYVQCSPLERSSAITWKSRAGASSIISPVHRMLCLATAHIANEHPFLISAAC